MPFTSSSAPLSIHPQRCPQWRQLPSGLTHDSVPNQTELISSGGAGSDWGFQNSPHALAVPFHQYTFSLFLHMYRRAIRGLEVRALVAWQGICRERAHCLRIFRSHEQICTSLTKCPVRENDPCPSSYKNRTTGCVSVDRSTWATLSTYNTPSQLDGHSRISRPRYVDAIQRRPL